ncbi:germination protein YpeB [Bacillus testis]|uniref:germination protein YpeB n=1 Tax=Bacillus testis TaxID=1622072 RepID=UPI00067E6918|nr:germination protein YpeB [Bacillus testis]
MAKNIIIALLAIAVAGTGFYGYKEHREKNAVLVQAENNYQRAFHDLSYQMDLLNDKIGTTLAMNTRKSLSPALTDVWRITSEAQSDVGQLPLTLMTFNQTEEFLNNIGNFSYRTAVRDLEKEPLSEEEYSTLQRLYKQSAEIQNDLRQVQANVMANNLRWTDVERAMNTGNSPKDNSIVDGFNMVEKKVGGYAEASQFGPSFVAHKEKDEQYRQIKGKEITKEEAVKIARKLVPNSSSAQATVVENRKGSDFPFYSVTLKDTNSDQVSTVDLTKKVGYPIIYMNNRDVKEANISLNEAEKKAKSVLDKQHFTSMEMYESSQYDSVAIFNFVHVEKGVRVYTDSIKVKIALDDGGLIGYSAENYLKTNKERKLDKPKLSLEEAKKKLHNKVKLMENRLAIITDPGGKEVLCYELLGVMNNETYRIFINADNGDEELVEKLNESEAVSSL